MANGGNWHNRAEWRRVEGPLQQLDPILAQFSKRLGLHVTKNQKDWPERTIVWGQGIQLLIQVYLANPEQLTFNMWLCASQDRDGKRYWKHETLIEGKPVAEFEGSFGSLLDEGRLKLESWSEQQLEYATDVAAIPPGT